MMSATNAHSGICRENQDAPHRPYFTAMVDGEQLSLVADDGDHWQQWDQLTAFAYLVMGEDHDGSDYGLTDACIDAAVMNMAPDSIPQR